MNSTPVDRWGCYLYNNGDDFATTFTFLLQNQTSTSVGWMFKAVLYR
jgi:hypothetical protein